MNETSQTSADRAECFCRRVGESFDRAADAFTPPESVRKHFRQARIEVLRGIREMIDYRIDRLSREGTQGTRVTVE